MTTPRFKVGDLVKGTYDLYIGDETLLIVSIYDCTTDIVYGKPSKRYKVVIADKIRNIRVDYVDRYFERLNDA